MPNTTNTSGSISDSTNNTLGVISLQSTVDTATLIEFPLQKGYSALEITPADLGDTTYVADTAKVTVDKNTWSKMEGKHISVWQQEKEKYLAGIQSTANYKLESISSNYRNRKRSLEQKIRDAYDEKIRRMRESELETATEQYQNKVNEINERAACADIHTSLIANGIIDIKRG